MPDTSGTRGMGLIPDYPDFRDYTEKTDEVKSILSSARGGYPKPKVCPYPSISENGAHPLKIKVRLVIALPMGEPESLNITSGNPLKDTWMLRGFFSIR